MAREAAEAAEAVVELTEEQFAECCSSPCGKCGRSSQEARFTCIPCIVNSKSEGRVQLAIPQNNDCNDCVVQVKKMFWWIHGSDGANEFIRTTSGLLEKVQEVCHRNVATIATGLSGMSDIPPVCHPDALSVTSYHGLSEHESVKQVFHGWSEQDYVRVKGMNPKALGYESSMETSRVSGQQVEIFWVEPEDGPSWVRSVKARHNNELRKCTLEEAQFVGHGEVTFQLFSAIDVGTKAMKVNPAPSSQPGGDAGGIPPPSVPAKAMPSLRSMAPLGSLGQTTGAEPQRGSLGNGAAAATEQPRAVPAVPAFDHARSKIPPCPVKASPARLDHSGYDQASSLSSADSAASGGGTDNDAGSASGDSVANSRHSEPAAKRSRVETQLRLGTQQAGALRRAPSAAHLANAAAAGSQSRRDDAVSVASSNDPRFAGMDQHQRPLHRYNVMQVLTTPDPKDILSNLRRSCTNAARAKSSFAAQLNEHQDQLTAASKLKPDVLPDQEMSQIWSVLSKIRPKCKELPAGNYADLVMRWACDESPLMGKQLNETLFFKRSLPWGTPEDKLPYNGRNPVMWSHHFTEVQLQSSMGIGVCVDAICAGHVQYIYMPLVEAGEPKKRQLMQNCVAICEKYMAAPEGYDISRVLHQPRALLQLGGAVPNMCGATVKDVEYIKKTEPLFYKALTQSAAYQEAIQSLYWRDAGEFEHWALVSQTEKELREWKLELETGEGPEIDAARGKVDAAVTLALTSHAEWDASLRPSALSSCIEPALSQIFVGQIEYVLDEKSANGETTDKQAQRAVTLLANLRRANALFSNQRFQDAIVQLCNLEQRIQSSSSLRAVVTYLKSVIEAPEDGDAPAFEAIVDKGVELDVLPKDLVMAFVKNESDKEIVLKGWHRCASHLVSGWPRVHEASRRVCQTMTSNMRFAGVDDITKESELGKDAFERAKAITRLEDMRTHIDSYVALGATPSDRYAKDTDMTLMNAIVECKKQHDAMPDEIKAVFLTGNEGSCLLDEIFARLKQTVESCGAIAVQDFASTLHIQVKELEQFACGMTDGTSWDGNVGQGCSFKVLIQKTKHSLQKVDKEDLNARTKTTAKALYLCC